jgi:class 3 adenylate cyclase
MRYQRPLALAFVVVASVALALVAERSGGLTGVTELEQKTLDWRQNTTLQSFQAGMGDREADIVIVFFDEFSVTDPEMGWAWEQPFPRAHIASVIDAVAGAGARTIGLDVYLQLLYPKLNAFDGGDDLLRDAIARAGNVILVGPVIPTDAGPVLGRPHPHFADVAAGVGTAEFPTAFETVREGALAVPAGGRLEPSFATALWAHARGVDVDSLMDQARRQGRVALPGLPGDLGLVPERWFEEGAGAGHALVVAFPIRYVGPPSSADDSDPVGAFPATASSLVDVTAMLMPELFQDKIVLIGSGFHDSDKFRTPHFRKAPPPDWAREGERQTYQHMFGVEIHANALQNMLDGEYVRPLSSTGKLLLLVALALLTGGVVFWRGAGWGGAVTVATALGVLAVAYWLWAGKVFVGAGGELMPLGAGFVWLPVVTPVLASVFAYVGSVAWVSVVEGREKRRIKSIFGTYVPADIVDEISNDPDALRRLNEGERRPLTLLFSDLAGFTNMSERMDPKDLLDYLNGYLQDMTRIVFDEKGTLDKYIGDAIMAFWNAPRPQPDHADRALRAAVLMQRKMAELNARWREADPEAEDLVVRIGINTGNVIVGNVGGGLRNDYSALGDAVNLAARLEPANKTYATLVMASQFTLDAADASAFRVRELDLIAVKGKVEPVKVYEVLELAGVALPAHREEAVSRYEAGLAAYKARDWRGAAKHFQAALEADPDDGPSAVYLGRAEEYATAPPPEDWDFVVRRTEK